MRWVGFIIVMTIFAGDTAGALLASAKGVGLPGMLEKPVSIRQGSRRSGYRGAGYGFIYFGRRRHYGGGYGYGK